MRRNIDKQKSDLLAYIQTDFPVTERPFLELANRIGSAEKAVCDTVRSLMTQKIIRALGPVFEPKKLGYHSTLVAAQVEGERVAELAALILGIREITHNYLRDNELNLWFTVTARSEEIMKDIIQEIEKFPGTKMLLNLPMVSVYKISAVFGVDRKSHALEHTVNDTYQALTESEQQIVRALQYDFPLVERPFAVIADTADTDESTIVETTQRWIQDGVIRRFGARLNHRAIGYTTNTLAAWSGEHIDIWGKKFAELNEVSHCYRRTPTLSWPYELYTMVHAQTKKEMNGILNTMKNIAPAAKMVSLKTLYELKKTSMKYFLEE